MNKYNVAYETIHNSNHQLEHQVQRSATSTDKGLDLTV